MKLSKPLYCASHFVIGLSLAATCTLSGAAVVVLDDFSTSTAGLFAPPVPSAVSTTAGSGFWNQRTLSLFDVVGAPDNGVNALVTQGVLSFSNGNTVRATLGLGYNFNFDQIAQALTNVTYYQVLIDQVQIDSHTVTVGGSARLTIHNGQSLVVASSNDLTYFRSPFNLTFRSDFAADSTWDNLRIVFTCKAGATAEDLRNLSAPDECGRNGSVPVAPSLALLGLGLLGVTASRRKQ